MTANTLFTTFLSCAQFLITGVFPNRLLKNVFFFYLLLLITFSLSADELVIDPPTIWQTQCVVCKPTSFFCACERENNVIIDLMNPLYENGMVTTREGGILQAEGLRIQAEKITYIRNLAGEFPIFTVHCEGNLLIDYKQWTLVGERLYYDFLNHTGYLINGRTAAPPWFIGGKEILLLEEGKLVVLDGYLSTSEGEQKDVAIHAPRLELYPDYILTAHDIHISLKKVPIFRFPRFSYDLKNIDRSPVAVKFAWGGYPGSTLSLLYRFLSWGALQGTARLDAFFGQGVGAGIDTVYNPRDLPTQFYTQNYWANDLAIFSPQRRDRYRFRGTYYDRIGNVTIDGLYDFVSDGQMAIEYQTKDFDLKTAGRTQIEVRRQECGWIANLFARARVNDFQSVNQELPSFQINWHPYEIPNTGVIVQSFLNASYLNYIFSDDVKPRDQHPRAARFALHPRLYRPFSFPFFTLTPEVGCIGIAYSNSPYGSALGQAIGDLGINLESSLSKRTSWWKHNIEPYAHWRLLTTPTVGVGKTFIFTINDGYDRFQALRFGVRNTFFTKSHSCLHRPLWIDLWANAFFDLSSTASISQTIPKGYLNIEWQPHPRIFGEMASGWNFQEKLLDFYNARIKWTLSESFAIAMEYRHRSRFDWRKADFYNFILDTVRSEKELLTSSLSDRRDTFLFHTFLRLNPDWNLKFYLRNGWNREKLVKSKRSRYLEYQINLASVLFQHWRFTAIYEKLEADHRFSFSLKLDSGPPSKSKCL